MPSSIIRHPQDADDGSEKTKQEFDRWRIAVDMVRRLREAGVICELGDISKTPN